MSAPAKWYQGVSRYQWLVVVIASAGWIFDAFEGQLFNVSRGQMLADILHVAPEHPEVRRWGDIFLGAFLVGGSFGGILFGWMGDRWGRQPTMIVTIRKLLNDETGVGTALDRFVTRGSRAAASRSWTARTPR